jgi:hypothetical protein
MRKYLRPTRSSTPTCEASTTSRPNFILVHGDETLSRSLHRVSLTSAADIFICTSGRSPSPKMCLFQNKRRWCKITSYRAAINAMLATKVSSEKHFVYAGHILFTMYKDVSLILGSSRWEHLFGVSVSRYGLIVKMKQCNDTGSFGLVRMPY